jgi:hypothetical protein
VERRRNRPPRGKHTWREADSSHMLEGSTHKGLDTHIAPFVLPIPSIERGVAVAGAMPIQTRAAITAVLDNKVRIDLTSLTLWPGPL